MNIEKLLRRAYDKIHFPGPFERFLEVKYADPEMLEGWPLRRPIALARDMPKVKKRGLNRFLFETFRVKKPLGKFRISPMTDLNDMNPWNWEITRLATLPMEGKKPEEPEIDLVFAEDHEDLIEFIMTEGFNEDLRDYYTELELEKAVQIAKIKQNQQAAEG